MRILRPRPRLRPRLRLRPALLSLALVVLVGGLSQGHGRPPADAALLFHDGTLVLGQVFILDDETVSILNEDGIFSFKRSQVSQVVFLAGHTLILKAEGRFTGPGFLEGELFYVGGIQDGQAAGTFAEWIRPDPTDPAGERFMVRTFLTLERFGLPRGTLSDWAVSEGLRLGERRGRLYGHLAGVITGGTGDFEGGHGTVEILANLNTVPDPATSICYFIFRFDDIDP